MSFYCHCGPRRRMAQDRRSNSVLKILEIILSIRLDIWRIVLQWRGGSRRHPRGAASPPASRRRRREKIAEERTGEVRPAFSRGQSGARTAPAQWRARAGTGARGIRANQGPAAWRGGRWRGGTKRDGGTTCRNVKTGPGRRPSRREGPLPASPASGYRMHTFPCGGAAPHAPIRRPGPRSGAQPRFRRQPRRSALLCTGCGGTRSQGWVSAFAGTTEGAKARAARPSGASDARPHEIRACGRQAKEGDRHGPMTEQATGYAPAAC